MLSSRHKVKFVSQTLPAKNISVTRRQKQVNPESSMHPLPNKGTVPSHKAPPYRPQKSKVAKRKAHLPRKNAKFQNAMAPLPRKNVKVQSAMPPLHSKT